jgi:type IV secretion system protein VirB6
MIVLCTPPNTGTNFLETMLRNLDCHASNIGTLGYQSFAANGGSGMLIITSVLTLFIAAFAIHMLFGGQPSFGTTSAAVIKIGVVLLIATSWPAYKVLIYDVVVLGPAELAGQVSTAALLPGSDGSLITRAQVADTAMTRLIAVGTGRTDIAARQNPLTAQIVQPAIINDDLAFAVAKTSYATGIVASFGLLRLLGGMALALAPLFAGLLLFSGTRGLFYGWIKFLATIVLSGVVTAVIAAVQLAIIEPWLSNVLTLRFNRFATPDAAFELMVITLIFVVLLFGSIMAMFRLCFATHVSAKFEAIMEPNGVQNIQPQVTQNASSFARQQLGVSARNSATSGALAPDLARSNFVLRRNGPQGKPTPQTMDAASNTPTQVYGSAVPLGTRYGLRSGAIATATQRRNDRSGV